MDVGTVFRWNDFPDPRFGKEIKPRWFIYLGETDSLLSSTIIVYLPTTTTQLRHFSSGGQMCRHAHHVFKANSSVFEMDCILDYDAPPYNRSKSELENNPDIEIKGKLDTNTLRMIYNNILKSNAYSPKVIMDIHRCLNNIGITGLKKP